MSNRSSLTESGPLVHLQRFFVREDPVYDAFAEKHQATTTTSRLTYLLLHLLPGIFAVIVLNIPAVYYPIRDAIGLPDRTFQYLLFIGVTYVWHMGLPFLILKTVDKLSFRESLAFLGLNRIDWKGVVVVLPVIMVVYTVVSIPWFLWPYLPLEQWLSAVPIFQMPDYSIFAGDFYAFPPLWLAFLFIGNFLGEEVYYRGYLMKKTAFLGRHNWWVTSALFALYHLWQVEQTWPLFLPALIFGAVMVLRKDIYVVIVLHVVLNLWWVNFMDASFVTRF